MQIQRLSQVQGMVKIADKIETVPDRFISGRTDITNPFINMKEDGTIVVGGIRKSDAWLIGHKFDNPDDWQNTWHNGVKRWLNLAMSEDQNFNAWVLEKFGFSPNRMDHPNVVPQTSQEYLRDTMESVPSDDIFSSRLNWFEKYAGKKSRYQEEKGPFSINRDDNDMRLVVCPKCQSWDVSKITEDDKESPGETISWKPINWGRNWDEAYSGTSMIVMKCNSKKCGTLFALYPEDGTRKISEKEAKQALKDGHLDMQDDGYDGHGHAPYLIFVEDPRK